VVAHSDVTRFLGQCRRRHQVMMGWPSSDDKVVMHVHACCETRPSSNARRANCDGSGTTQARNSPHLPPAWHHTELRFCGQRNSVQAGAATSITTTHRSTRRHHGKPRSRSRIAFSYTPLLYALRRNEHAIAMTYTRPARLLRKHRCCARSGLSCHSRYLCSGDADSVEME
jgi:hypothetical protein